MTGDHGRGRRPSPGLTAPTIFCAWKPTARPPVGSSAQKSKASIVDGTVAVCQNFSSFNRAGLEQRFPQAQQPEEELSQDRAAREGGRGHEGLRVPCTGTSHVLMGGTLLRAFRGKAWKPGSERLVSAQQTDLHFPTEARRMDL